MKRKIFSVLFTLVLVLSVSMIMATPVAADPATITVGATKTYQTITTAISHASPGDTISVDAGTYNAALGETFPINVNIANLTIQSVAGAATTIIDPGTTGQGAIKISAANVTLNGFTIKQGTLAHDASHPLENTVWVAANYSTIKNNIIIGASGNNACIYIGDRTGNTPTGAVFGYQVSTPLGHTIQGNTFRFAQSGEGWGIFAYDLSDSLITSNNFVGDAADVGTWDANEGAPGTGIIIHKATAATGTPSPGGGYVVISNNTAQYLKYTFLTFYAAYMYDDSIGGGYEQPEASTVDKVIVTNNIVHDCGTTTGFASGTAVNFHRAKKDDAYGAKGAALTVGTNGVTIGPGNSFYNLDYGVSIDTPRQDTASAWQCVLSADKITVVNNNIYNIVSYGLGNGTIAANQVGGAKTITATNNWWGSINGPTHSGNTFNSGSQGAVVSDSVTYVPWLNGVYLTGTSFAPVKNTTRTTSFSSIQAAIDDAATVGGDIITCEAGTYNGTGENFPIDINKGITLKSVAGAATTIINAGTNQAIAIATNTVTLGVTGHGFTLKGGGTGVVVTNADSDTGIVIQGNIFRQATHQGEGNGIYVNQAKTMTIDGNSFYGDALWTSSTVEMTEGGPGNGIQVVNTVNTGSGLNITNNTAYYLKYTFLTLKGNIYLVLVTGNTAHDNGKYGIDIAVDSATAVQASGLTVRNNTFYNNRAGLTIETGVTGADHLVFQFNDVYTNTNINKNSPAYGGVKNFTTTAVNALYNYWGDASGPTITGNDRGAGDAVSATYVTYQPWLTTSQTTVYPSNVRYFGYNWCSLSQGWNIWSTPIALDAQCDTWGEYKALGTDLALATGANAYYFNGTTQSWVTVSDSYVLNPCDAIYINMASAQTSPILFSPSTSAPSKALVAGWNLVSASYINDIDTPNMSSGIAAQTALASVYYVSGANNVGYSQVVSPAVNQSAWSGVRGPAIDTAIAHNMLPCKGYWIYMTNPGTLAGTVFTPISPLINPT